jgi:hypothetical protein
VRCDQAVESAAPERQFRICSRRENPELQKFNLLGEGIDDFDRRQFAILRTIRDLGEPYC